MNVILSSIVWTPLLFALIALFLPERDEERARPRADGRPRRRGPELLRHRRSSRSSDRSGSAQGGGLASAYQENHTWFWTFLFHAYYDLTADGMTLPLLVVTTTSSAARSSTPGRSTSASGST